jgi:hypothetical protein
MKMGSKSGQGSTNKGAKSMSGYAKRPAKLKGRVANDVAPTPRSAVMPPPTTDTPRGGGRKVSRG